MAAGATQVVRATEEAHMQQSLGQRPVTAPAVVGLLLILVGAVVLIARTAGVNLLDQIGPWGWPLFIIVPGLVLLGASLLPARPTGVGFATSGSVVTAVGLLLAYQQQSGHWESWAYAWALLPGAAGVGLLLYGLYASEGAMVRRGLLLATIAAVLFAVGAWFFEGLFAGDVRPDSLELWPVMLIVLGGLIVLSAFLRAGVREGSTAAGPPAAERTSTRSPGDAAPSA
jgi:hypothetical protein